MKKYLLVLSALVLFAFSSCQKFAGEPVTKTFGIKGSYTALEVQDAFDVTVSNEVDSITIIVGERVMPKVVVEVIDNTLKIYIKSTGNLYGGEQKAIIPYNADLTSVDLSGASGFHAEYGLSGQKVEVKLSGASDFYCNIDANEVDIDLSGASNFYGDILADKIDMDLISVDEVDINLSGASNFYGNIVADEINMDLSGSSNIEGNVAATELDLEMTGASDATLEGLVGKLNIDLAGASNIVKQVVGNHYALVCDQCEGTMSGSSDAYIHCDGKIKVILSGGSELHFTGDGNPANSSISSGSGIIHDVLP